MATVSNNLKNISNSSLISKSGFTAYVNQTIFGNIFTVLIIVFIALIFIGIGVYYMLKQATELEIQQNSSYYGKDIALYEPVFENTAKNINECVAICQNDITCDGITYNQDTEACLGTKNGMIRQENSNYSAWVKPNDFVKNTTKDFDMAKATLVGFTTGTKNISGEKIPNPYMLGHFAYSFNITITDFYKNYGYWRHVFHKGSPINDTMTYQSWENLVKDIPIQTIGVWMAPFTNNLRIAVTTTSEANTNNGVYSHAFEEKCSDDGQCFITDMPSGRWVDRSRMGDGSIAKAKLETFVEYFDQDLQNVPVNRKLNITINFRGKDVEVFFDGKIVKVTRMDGITNNNKSGVYVMNDKSFGGEINNLLYYPDALKLDVVKAIVEVAHS